jgi:hypothetical protein
MNFLNYAVLRTKQEKLPLRLYTMSLASRLLSSPGDAPESLRRNIGVGLSALCVDGPASAADGSSLYLPAPPQLAGELTTLGLAGAPVLLFFHQRARQMFTTAPCIPPEVLRAPAIGLRAVNPGKPVDLRRRRRARLGDGSAIDGPAPAASPPGLRDGNSVVDVTARLGNRVSDDRRTRGDVASGSSRSSSSSQISARSVHRDEMIEVGRFRGSGGRCSLGMVALLDAWKVW